MWLFLDPQEQYEFVNNQKNHQENSNEIYLPSAQALDHEWQEKMIFSGYLVQPPIINVDSPAILHSYGDKLIPFILNHYEACLLRNHLDWTHPLVVRNGVDDYSLQEFGHLIFHHI